VRFFAGGRFAPQIPPLRIQLVCFAVGKGPRLIPSRRRPGYVSAQLEWSEIFGSLIRLPFFPFSGQIRADSPFPKL